MNIEASTPLQRAWRAAQFRREDGAPMLPRNFVFEHASAVRLVDLRNKEQAKGLLGHIPGSEFSSADEMLAGEVSGQPIILLSKRGGEAGLVALALEKAGHEEVAALEGGIVGWRQMGFGTTRDQGRASTDVIPTTDPEGGVTLENVRQHVAQTGAVQWVQLSALMALANTSCVDGREERHIVGVPGGDMGEFVMTLTAIEQMSGESYGRDQVQDTLLAYLDSFGSFYMHSDTHGLQHLVEVLRADAQFDGHLPDDDDRDGWRAFITSPPQDLQPSLMEHMVQPDNTGCGHLKQNMLHGSEYGVRMTLVQDAIRSFLEMLWAGSPELRYVVLYGGHAEKAVVNVTLDTEPWQLGFVPVICPAIGGHQVFVNHPQVASYKRKAYVRLHTTTAPIRLAPDRAPALEQAIEALAGRQLTATLGHLASGLPLFEIQFSNDGGNQVAQVGQVG